MIDMWVKLMLSCSDERKLYERLAGHCCRLPDAHQLEDCRSHVSELTVLHLLNLVAGVHYDKWNIVERVSCVRCAVLVYSVVSVTVISCDEDHIALCLSYRRLSISRRRSLFIALSQSLRIFVFVITMSFLM